MNKNGLCKRCIKGDGICNNSCLISEDVDWCQMCEQPHTDGSNVCSNCLTNNENSNNHD